MLDTRNVHPGQYVRNLRTGNLYRVDRLTPAGAAGTSYADGPTVHAQPVRDDGTLGDFRAAIRDGSYSYPSTEWELATLAGHPSARVVDDGDTITEYDPTGWHGDIVDGQV